MAKMKKLDIQVIITTEKLNENIVHHQEELHKIGEKYGLTHELTIKKSQELDFLMNESIRKK